MFDPIKLAKEIEDIIVDPMTPRDEKDGYISIAAPVNEWIIIIAKLRGSNIEFVETTNKILGM